MSKNAVITGASRGIGLAAARYFAGKGWNIAVCSRHGEKEMGALQGVCESLGVSCLTFTGDMGVFADADRFITSAIDTFGSVDLLVNNAGISHVGLLSDMTPEEWDHVLRTNLTSVFNCCRPVIPHMVRRQSGRIINISSIWGSTGASCEAAYSASKGGVNSLTKALAKELAPSHICVNAIACGVIDTDMNRCFTEEERRVLTDDIPACRMGTPEEAARMIYLLARAPEYLTGQVITLDGGFI